MSAIPLLTWLTILALRAVLADPEPKAARWHSDSISPDGPWNAVEVMIGNYQAPVALFPGCRWQSYVVTTDYCKRNTSINHCTGGSYPQDKAIRELLDGIDWQPDAQDYMQEAEVQGNKSHMFMDNFDMSFGSGLIPNVSMA